MSNETHDALQRAANTQTKIEEEAREAADEKAFQESARLAGAVERAAQEGQALHAATMRAHGGDGQDKIAEARVAQVRERREADAHAAQRAADVAEAARIQSDATA